MKLSAPCGPFAHTWRADVLQQRPLIFPPRHFTYPHQAEEVERGALEVLVHPDRSAPFLATFALGFADALAPTALWTHPDPNTLCAVAGGYAYLVDTRKPEHCKQVAFRPVLAVQAVETPLALLLFVGNRSLLAYGAEGKAWESPRVSDEGVTITVLTESTIEGRGWHLQTDSEVDFALDLRTGAFIETGKCNLP